MAESARFALRAATSEAHERLDALFSRFDLGDRADYSEFLLAQAGAFLPVGAALDRAGALDSIDASRPTVAMLDINLGDRTSYPIADRLAELNIPFLFATGYGEQANLPMEHRGRLVVQKPYTLENVARAMDGVLGPV